MVHGGVLHHVVQHGRLEDLRIGDACPAHQDLERFQQVLGVGRAGGAGLVAVVADRELHRPRHRVGGGRGQQAA